MSILDNILASVAAALVIALGVVLLMNANLRADLARADANAVTLGRVNADLKNATEKQNQAIAAFQAASDARAIASEKAVKAAALQAKRYIDRAAKIEKSPTHGGDCAAATQILRNYLTQSNQK